MPFFNPLFLWGKAKRKKETVPTYSNLYTRGPSLVFCVSLWFWANHPEFDGGVFWSSNLRDRPVPHLPRTEGARFDFGSVPLGLPKPRIEKNETKKDTVSDVFCVVPANILGMLSCCNIQGIDSCLLW